MAERDAIIRRCCIGVIACLLVALLAGAEPPARAAPLSPPPTFTVTSNADAHAAAPLGNGVCQSAPGPGACTLRAAIEKADNWSGGGVTIILPALTGGNKYLLTIDQLIITRTMTIIGGGAANTIIDGSGITPTTRVLNIEQHAIATISGVTIQGGDGGAGGGGGISVADSALTLHDSIVTSNTASIDGAGIINFASSLTVTDSIISHNTAGTEGAGITIANGVTTLSRVTISSNTSKFGGGLFNNSPDLLDIVDSTINDNTATSDGGGIYNQGKSLAVINSTISGNFSNRNGGGIFNKFMPFDCCTVSLYNATIAGNQANAAVIGGTGGGIFNSAGVTVTLQNTLLDGNVHSTDVQDVFDDCAGSIISQDYNLFSTTAGCTISGGTHDLPPQPGQTGPLQNNSGPTFTRALLAGSPAIDAGNPAGCLGPATVLLTMDQRGARRPANGASATVCDIGAFEIQRTLDLPLVHK